MPPFEQPVTRTTFAAELSVIVNSAPGEEDGGEEGDGREQRVIRDSEGGEPYIFERLRACLHMRNTTYAHNRRSLPRMPVLGFLVRLSGPSMIAAHPA